MAQFNSANSSLQDWNKTLYEVVMVADKYGNPITSGNPSGMAVDSFGRARSSSPVTLFDSFHRYQDNESSATSNTAGGTYSHNANTSAIEMTVDSTSNAEVIRETKRVFAYQPGKSLQILSTGCFGPAKAGLRNRTGYFGSENGVYFERDGSDIYFVKRTKVDGTVQNVRVPQSDWNHDALDGNGPSHLTLDTEKSYIFFMDIEWLGVGSIRCGFVINGMFIHCHTFNHANIITSSYMTTACLPGRVEIKNTGGMTGTATQQQICFTVISEGGYSLRGKMRSYYLNPVAASQYRLATPGTFYPVLSFRLNPDRPDSIVVPKNISLSGINQGTYQWKIVSGSTVSGAVWANTPGSNNVQYNSNTSATISGGTDLTSGYITVTNQAASAIKLADGTFDFQLERNSLSNTMITFTLAVTCDTATANVVAGMDWQEIT